MHSKDISVSRIENEKHLLRFLCASREEIAQRQKLFQRLTQYSWLANDNQILFEAIGELLATAPQQILSHLPAALTRRGFPDISCDALAEPSTMNAPAAFALAEELLRASQ
ncbi:MAG TPA: hypothetical protein VKB26_04555 [Candidatus Acidoferrales bacterium]|nr:hypothetical protein [Candidatus Acidoferrales bacterium]